MSFPETVDEILDVSEDEGERLELGHALRGLLAALGMGTGWGAAWPHWGLATRKQKPSSHLLAWSSPVLCRRVVPRPEDGVQRELGHSEHRTMPCSPGDTSPQPT